MTTANGSEPQGGASLFWLVYGQIAAMLGAFSLLVFLHNFIDLGLKGIIAQAFDGWVQYVRPTIGYPLHWLVSLLPEAWRFDVTDFIKDYAAVGVVFTVSAVRTKRLHGDADFGLQTVPYLLSFIVVWPGLFLALPFVLLAQGGGDRWVSRLAVLVAPLIYLGLLFAANAWLV